MSLLLRRFALVAGLLVASSRAQRWRNAVNISMCTWREARVNTIRDTVYLDGGSLWWQVGYDDGSVSPESTNNNEGLLYYLNLNSTFNTATSNLTELFGSIPKAGGIANNLAPTYHDGVMWANDNKFYLYGGLLNPTQSLDEPSEDQILAYEQYQYGPYSDLWRPQFINTDLDDGVTRYITNGAGVSSPSQNLGFYISGLRAPDWGPIYSNGSATALSQQMIRVDMEEMRNPVFSNVTIPDTIPARANAEAIWVPVSDRGIVVLIGGVRHLESIFPDGLSEEDEAESRRVSPGYMETVAVYDVAGDRWYLQNTTGDIPPQLTQFCSVYASASDGSSHNIYIYGGYDGLQPVNNPTDDVYVLSLPSFQWIYLYDGDGRGRKGHKCVKPYPNQMLVLGGLVESSNECVEMIRVFNLNTGRFQDTYDPTQWSEYEVPNLVWGRIGGDASGGATRTSPESWTNTSLADVFSAAYTSPIATWYPYNSTNITTTTVPGSGSGGGGGGGFPGWAGAVIGGVVGLLVLGGALTFWVIRRRRKQGGRRHSEVSHGSRVMQWVHAGAFRPPGGKDAEEMTTVSGGFTNESTAAPSITTRLSRPTAEAGSEPVYEMPGQSSRYAVELPTTYNDNPFPAPSPMSSPVHTSPAMSPGPTGSITPVSPEPPQEREADLPTRSGHTRNVSSLSSVHLYTQLCEADAGVAQQPRYVSEFSEASISLAGTRLGDDTTRRENRGLELDDIPDTEGER
ncbi:hypothetical protein BJX63DRAFT_207880 [Aspergillus granulosus]|uniref:Kelch repeat protein n=1 Tax=Aspergillus granulosus TaxID=176169 RepID=A0ABR4HEE4_9EURO